ARGKLLLLRQIIASEVGHEKHLRAMLIRSLATFTAIFQGILELENLPIPSDRHKLFERATQIGGFPNQVFQEILQIRDSGVKKNVKVIFKDLLHCTEQIVKWVDRYRVS
ncbi:MAG: hypothetical protein ABH878_06110, partial [bacterium]